MKFIKIILDIFRKLLFYFKINYKHTFIFFNTCFQKIFSYLNIYIIRIYTFPIFYLKNIFLFFYFIDKNKKYIERLLLLENKNFFFDWDNYNVFFIKKYN